MKKLLVLLMLVLFLGLGSFETSYAQGYWSQLGTFELGEVIPIQSGMTLQYTGRISDKALSFVLNRGGGLEPISVTIYADGSFYKVILGGWQYYVHPYMTLKRGTHNNLISVSVWVP